MTSLPARLYRLLDRLSPQPDEEALRRTVQRNAAVILEPFAVLAESLAAQAQARRAAEERVGELIDLAQTRLDRQLETAALLRRLARSHEDLIATTTDPGTEALTVNYLVRQRIGLGPVNDQQPFDREALAEDLLHAGVFTDADDDRVFCLQVADSVIDATLHRALPSPSDPGSDHFHGCPTPTGDPFHCDSCQARATSMAGE